MIQFRTSRSRPPDATGPQFWKGMLVFVLCFLVSATIGVAVADAMPPSMSKATQAVYPYYQGLALLSPVVFFAVKRRWIALGGYFALPLAFLLMLGGCWLAFGAGRP